MALMFVDRTVEADVRGEHLQLTLTSGGEAFPFLLDRNAACRLAEVLRRSLPPLFADAGAQVIPIRNAGK